jgi:tRNA(fMet)-specific endonuclease VapC
MTVRYLLDTNTVSYYLRRSSPELETRLSNALKHQTVAISVLTRAELRFGQAGMTIKDRRRGLIDQFLLRLPNISWTHQAADLYGAIKALHKLQGTPIGELDTQIAAHSLAEDLILVTHNTRHFEKVPDLALEDWMV